MALPVLYSFRRCPYAIRARMALASAAIDYELREVLLKDKPAAMLALSPKGTVPVLQLNEQVIDESLAVMRWALTQNDPDNLMQEDLVSELVTRNDDEFKYWLDRYKYFERFPEYDRDYYLDKALVFLRHLEDRLRANADLQTHDAYLSGARPGWEDVAIFPFVRQFCFADEKGFAALPLPRLQRWLQEWLQSALFTSVMHKYPVWQLGEPGLEIRQGARR